MIVIDVNKHSTAKLQQKKALKVKKVMDLSRNQKTFQTSENNCQVSLNNGNRNENNSSRTTAQINPFRLQAEKTFLQKKQEAMKKWMDRHREDCTKTIVRVCTTAKAIVERLAEEKNREMQEMMIEMEKAHQEELKRIRMEARGSAIRDLVAVYNKQKRTRNTNAYEKDSNLGMAARGLVEGLTQTEQLAHNQV